MIFFIFAVVMLGIFPGEARCVVKADWRLFVGVEALIDIRSKAVCLMHPSRSLSHTLCLLQQAFTITKFVFFFTFINLSSPLEQHACRVGRELNCFHCAIYIFTIYIWYVYMYPVGVVKLLKNHARVSNLLSFLGVYSLFVRNWPRL